MPRLGPPLGPYSLSIAGLLVACGSAGTTAGSKSVGGTAGATTGGAAGGATAGKGSAGGTTAGSAGIGGSGGALTAGGSGGASGSSGTAPSFACDDEPATSGKPSPPDAPLPPCGSTVAVSTTAELDSALTSAAAGTCIVLDDGSYTVGAVNGLTGTEAKPIVVRAKNRGKAMITAGTLTISASAHLVFEGFEWTSPGTVQVKTCDHCRITRNRFHVAETGDLDWIVVRAATNTRIDHNEIGPKAHPGNPVSVFGDNVTTSAKNTRIDHNYLHDIGPFTGGNPGGEAIRMGVGSLGNENAHTIVEHNLFERCDGDPETISAKTSENVIRYNTMRASAGFMSLRIGNRTRVCGNFILGTGKAATGGIRMTGEDHVVFDNYVQGVTAVTLQLHDGTVDHAQVKRALVVHNTFLGDGDGLELGAGAPPTDCTLANNIFDNPAGNAIVVKATSPGLISIGNLAHPGNASYPPGFLDVDPGLVKTGELFLVVKGSKAIDAAAPGFAFVTVDMSGQPRDAKPDIGADELSSAPVWRRPLTPADVGPDAPLRLRRRRLDERGELVRQRDGRGERAAFGAHFSPRPANDADQLLVGVVGVRSGEVGELVLEEDETRRVFERLALVVLGDLRDQGIHASRDRGVDAGADEKLFGTLALTPLNRGAPRVITDAVHRVVGTRNHPPLEMLRPSGQRERRGRLGNEAQQPRFETVGIERLGRATFLEDGVVGVSSIERGARGGIGKSHLGPELYSFFAAHYRGPGGAKRTVASPFTAKTTLGTLAAAAITQRVSSGSPNRSSLARTVVSRSDRRTVPSRR